MKKNLSSILVIDLEATCVEKREDHPNFINEIIEIGVTEVNLKNLTIMSSDGFLVKPQHSIITPFCTQLTTIDDELLKDALSYPEVVAQFIEKYQPKGKPWCSWGDYDYNQFVANNKLYNVPEFLTGSHNNLKNTVAIFNGSSREFGLDRMVKDSGLQFHGTHHRGISDSINIANILIKAIKQYRGI